MVGCILLMCPFSSRDGTATPMFDALFTATSATCVTGLVVCDTYTHWSLFGQTVIILLIQIGGLGFMTIITMFSIMLKRRIGLKERSILQESVSTMQLGGVVRLIRKVVLGTFMFEGIGAVLLSIRFIPRMGFVRGIFNGIFMSISAFCNAGFDLNGKYGEYSSLVSFQDDEIVNIVIMLLILIGGIGFFVWDDIHRYKLKFKKYQLHTKIVLTLTLWLTIVGAVLFFCFEYDNTIADMSLSDAVTTSFFSSVTPRTAGFNTVDTADLKPASKLLTIIYMFIGGSPGSTAGGAKTTTVAVLFISAWSTLRNSDDCNIFNRRLENESIRKATSVITVNSILIILSILIISFIQSELNLVDIVFEVFSAIDTVGMTTGVTRELTTVPRIVIMILMYCGRVGSVSFALMFTENRKFISVKNPVEKINVG
ncbi:MAG: TrkH family potassium uptake protein [Oscillospiraceae bacterium]|nr:TrkH family potassium uptake protein [Oscillospiraceae bacterium]